MRPEQIEIGAEYRCRLERGVVRVRVDSAPAGGGWMVTEVETGQPEHVRRHEQFRERWSPPAPAYSADVAETIAETGTYPPPLDRIDGERLALDAKRRAADYDPNRCATPRCKFEPALTYLGKPLCQACWEAECQDTLVDGALGAEENTTMSKKSKKATKGGTKSNAKRKGTKADAREAVAAVVANDGPAAEAVAKAETKPAMKARAKQAAAEPKPKRVSALDAAAEVLKAEAKPMRAKEMIAAMAAHGLWTSPNGKTPEATLYAAMLREIGTKGDQARFRKADRGQFEYAG